MYIIGRFSIRSLSIATGRTWILCIPKIPTCGLFRIGVDIREPNTPPFVIVNVPPCSSFSESLLSRAFYLIHEFRFRFQRSLIGSHRVQLEQLIHLELLLQYRYHRIFNDKLVALNFSI